MKPLVVEKVGIMTMCDIYMCGNMARHSIHPPDAPPGMCVRLCNEHMESLTHLLAAKVAEKGDDSVISTTLVVENADEVVTEEAVVVTAEAVVVPVAAPKGKRKPKPAADSATE